MTSPAEPEVSMQKRLFIAGILLCLNFVPFAIVPLIGEKMSLWETIFAVLTIPPSLMVAFFTRDPVKVLIRAFCAGLVIIAVGLLMRECGKKLVEIGTEMNKNAESR